jgi:hypothetical protein
MSWSRGIRIGRRLMAHSFPQIVWIWGKSDRACCAIRGPVHLVAVMARSGYLPNCRSGLPHLGTTWRLPLDKNPPKKSWRMADRAPIRVGIISYIRSNLAHNSNRPLQQQMEWSDRQCHLGLYRKVYEPETKYNQWPLTVRGASPKENRRSSMPRSYSRFINTSFQTLRLKKIST